MKKLNITKDVVLALLGAATIATSSLYVMSEKEILEKDNQINSLKQTIQKDKKELNLRDDVLDKYRQHLDSLEADLKKKDDLLKEKENIIKQKDSKIKELQSKECPTQVNPTTRGYARQGGKSIELTLSFYGDFAHENGGYASLDAQGNKLVAGTVASNVYPFGTKFIINGQTFTVRDRGGKNFNSSNRLDVFVPRTKGESNGEYGKRIRHYGIKKIKATIL